jgi:nucleosome binding factor SPN SPT16 subunit
MEASQDLDSRNRMDEDGLHEEQEERHNRKKWNEAFRTFVKRVEDHTTKESEKPHPESPKLEFDSPYRELVFTGTPSKSIVDVSVNPEALTTHASRCIRVIVL